MIDHTQVIRHLGMAEEVFRLVRNIKDADANKEAFINEQKFELAAEQRDQEKLCRKELSVLLGITIN